MGMLNVNPAGTKMFKAGTSRTKQSFKAECDVNRIVARHRLTGQLTHVTTRLPQFLDMSSIPDYQTALNLVLDAQAGFMQLPAVLRKRFGNNPAALLDFVRDPANADELVALGLAVAKPKDGSAGGSAPKAGAAVDEPKSA